MKDVTPSFFLGGMPVCGQVILAPMDGYSSWPFRSLCRELGSSLSYTEFVHSRDVLSRPASLERKLFYRPGERPIIFQIYGNDNQQMIKAALQLEELGPDGIDINLGCPTPSIASRGAGAGLMRKPLQVARLFRTLSSKIAIPLTAKIRLGWNDCLNYRLIARIIAENGGQMIAVHARTKEERHNGPPDLDAIAEIKSSLSIPVIGNGGITGVADLQHMLDYTGCDGVMVGRGAIKNPWIFSFLDRDQIPPGQVKDVLLDHLDRSLSFYGPERGLILFRKHAAEYLEPYQLSPARRRKILTRKEPQAFISLVEEVFQKLEARGY
ncbi:MAG: tRNA-dihydrouridine synthase family protein [Anaerolineales bacterium]|nr:tRNA-dihydrouridine synthase family protein [Anaerolineales bacterium]